MKTWTRRLLIVTALVAIPAVGAVAWASDDARREKYMRRYLDAHVENVLDDIDATPQQRAAVQKAKEQIVAKVHAFRSQRTDVREELLDMLAADKVDTARLNQIVDEKAAEAKTLASEIIPILANVHAQLTPAQRKELAERVEAFKGRRGWGHW